MRQLGLFGGSEPRPAVARAADQQELFAGCEWLWAAQEWCRLEGFTMTGWGIAQRFTAGGVRYSVRWDDESGSWDIQPTE